MTRQRFERGDVPGGWAALRSETFTDLKRKLQDEGVKVVPVVQRTAWTDGARERTINLLTKTKNRTALVERIVQFVGIARLRPGLIPDFLNRVGIQPPHIGRGLRIQVPALLYRQCTPFLGRGVIEKGVGPGIKNLVRHR